MIAIQPSLRKRNVANTARVARSFTKIYCKHFADGEILLRGNILGKRGHGSGQGNTHQREIDLEIYQQKKGEKNK